jgi:hypothetical protein
MAANFRTALRPSTHHTHAAGFSGSFLVIPSSHSSTAAFASTANAGDNSRQHPNEEWPIQDGAGREIDLSLPGIRRRFVVRIPLANACLSVTTYRC